MPVLGVRHPLHFRIRDGPNTVAFSFSELRSAMRTRVPAAQSVQMCAPIPVPIFPASTALRVGCLVPAIAARFCYLRRRRLVAAEMICPSICVISKTRAGTLSRLLMLSRVEIASSTAVTPRSLSSGTDLTVSGGGTSGWLQPLPSADCNLWWRLSETFWRDFSAQSATRPSDDPESGADPVLQSKALPQFVPWPARESLPAGTEAQTG